MTALSDLELGSELHYLRGRSPSGEEAVLASTNGEVVVVADVLGVPSLDFDTLTALSLVKASWDHVQKAVSAALKDGRTTSIPFEPLSPVTVHAEVWASGVTYERSRQARIDESGSDIYDLIYSADRPELFLKADASRTAGSTQQICVRDDAQWQVPEPELVLLLNRTLDIIGFSLGNDVTARDIEAANPLYLPQAKMWPRSCAIGPGFVPALETMSPDSFKIHCHIERSGVIVWEDDIDLAAMRRRFADLVSYLQPMVSGRSDIWLMTGTGLVPPDDISLTAGDTVVVEVPEIGRLRNRVEALSEWTTTARSGVEGST